MLHRKRCRCCNRPDCTIASDDFNRADNSDIGPNWTETSGSFSISGNKLVPSASFENIALFNTPDPEDPADDGIRWSAKFNFGGSNGTFYWIVDYVNSSNFRYAVVQCSGPTTATLGVYQKIGGSDTSLTASLNLTGFSWSGTYTLSVCWGLQGIVPACSEGSTVWVWTDNGDSTFSWQPRLLYDDCTDPACTPVYPDFDGTVVGEETTTGCVPIFGSEGDPVFGIAATFGSDQGVAASVEPLGGTTVGLLTAGASTSAFFDDAVLARLRSGCPGCTALTTCSTCATNTAPQYLLGILEGAANDTCDKCAAYNGSYLMQGGVDSSGNTDCPGGSGGEVQLGCSWAGSGAADTCEGGSGFGIRVGLFNIDGEYWLYAYGFEEVTQDPAALDSNLPVWRLSLGEFEDNPDCNTLFDTEYTLPYFCEFPEGVGATACDWTGSTVKVRKP